MLRTRHVSVDLTARVRGRDRLDRNTLADGAAAAAGLAHACQPDLGPIGVDGALRDSHPLSPDERSALVLKVVIDLRDEDVAQAMSLPVGTVKCHAPRRRKLLAARLRRNA